MAHFARNDIFPTGGRMWMARENVSDPGRASNLLQKCQNIMLQIGFLGLIFQLSSLFMRY